MKKNKLIRAMELVDDDLLEKASPHRRKEVKRASGKRIAVIACAACLMLALGLWLFIPFSTALPDISMYQDSEYYSVIQKLNPITYLRPANKNNFEKYIAGIFKGAAAEDMSGNMGDPGSDGYVGEYAEVTDNQVLGVTEGDRIKRSDRYIYYLTADRLEVYTIAGADSRKVATYTVSFAEVSNGGGKSMQYESWELYLSQDCKTVTIIAPYYDRTAGGNYVYLVSLDVSDLTNIKQTAGITVSGFYLSSRMVKGELLLMTRFDVGYNPDFSDVFSFIPHIDDGNGKKCLPVEDILTPDAVNNAQYTVICTLQEEGLALRDHTALLSYSTNAYVSAEDIFVTHPFTERETKGNVTYGTARTEIARVSYGEGGLTHKGSVTVNGTVKDQYSMDVYNGVLRVVTTTRVNAEQERKNGETVMMDREAETNADLYCISLTDLRIVASVIAFAPKGESAESVRFDGNSAYVCTAVVATLSDPVYFFDLSDLANITCKDTGVIEGYSTSLINLGDGYLLGIGVGEDFSTLKIEVYRESENGVVSVCSYEQEKVGYSTDYKSYFINREQGLIGLGILEYNKSMEEGSYYLLLHFNGNALNVVFKQSLVGDNSGKRGILIDGYFYMLGENGLVVRSISE